MPLTGLWPRMVTGLLEGSSFARHVVTCKAYAEALCLMLQSVVSTDLRNAGPEPKKFTVGSGQLAKVSLIVAACHTFEMSNDSVIARSL